MNRVVDDCRTVCAKCDKGFMHCVSLASNSSFALKVWQLPRWVPTLRKQGPSTLVAWEPHQVHQTIRNSVPKVPWIQRAGSFYWTRQGFPFLTITKAITDHTVEFNKPARSSRQKQAIRYFAQTFDLLLSVRSTAVALAQH